MDKNIYVGFRCCVRSVYYAYDKCFFGLVLISTNMDSKTFSIKTERSVLFSNCKSLFTLQLRQSAAFRKSKMAPEKFQAWPPSYKTNLKRHLFVK